jgi:hypothetical protein
VCLGRTAPAGSDASFHEEASNTWRGGDCLSSPRGCCNCACRQPCIRRGDKSPGAAWAQRESAKSPRFPRTRADSTDRSTRETPRQRASPGTSQVSKLPLHVEADPVVVTATDPDARWPEGQLWTRHERRTCCRDLRDAAHWNSRPVNHCRSRLTTRSGAEGAEEGRAWK